MARLQGKAAIITGATGGIGEATARLFLREGASVMLVGRSAEKLRSTCARIEVDNPQVGANRLAQSVADAADEAATAAAVAAAVKAFGGVDILIANAGTEGLVKPIEAISMAEFEQVLRTNVLGVWLGMKYCVEPMKKRGGGSMIAMSSMAGVIGSPGIAPYISSKHAVCGLVKSAALELGPSNIRVNAIAPGMIDNRMLNSLAGQIVPGRPEAMLDASKERIAMRRFGTDQEVAYLAAYLASDESSYCNGGVFTMDGGYTAA